VNRLLYTLTLEAPLLVGELGGDPNSVATAPRVRASTVIGALAARWLRAHPEVTDAAADPTFRRLFLGEGCVFLDANPATGNTLDVAERLLPCPRSVMENKAAAFGEPVDLAAEPERCADAEAQWIAFDDLPEFVQWSSTKGTRTCTGRSPRRQRTMHHVRDRAMGRPTEGGLFFYEAIEPGEIFMGAIEGEAADLDVLRALLEEGPLVLGRSRTARYGGQATVHFPEGVAPSSWREAGASDDDYDEEATGRSLVIATVLSDCFVRSAETGEIDPHAFVGALEAALRPSGALPAQASLGEPVATFVDIGRVHGHVAAWQMARGTAASVVAGSVFVFEANTGARPGDVVRVGERTHEGYGRVALNLQGGASSAEIRIDSASLAPQTHDPRSTDSSSALSWTRRQLSEQWYAEQFPAMVDACVAGGRSGAPRGALSALRTAIARGEWPKADLPVAEALKKAGLGAKSVDALRGMRLPEPAREALPAIAKLSGPGGGEFLKQLAETLPWDGRRARPDALSDPPSDTLARRFVDELLQALRRRAQKAER
jgi:hypothetical protein